MSSEEVASRKDTMESLSQKDVKGGMQPAGEGHKMSLALTIGATIALIGLILLLYGLFGNADYGRSDGININLWWGLLMLVFGLLMTAGGYISARRAGR
jgi:drug/metabolite transporter (DMT)-like permease